jgi:rhamnosyltransferase
LAPRVSTIVRTYNSAKTVEATLHSLREQSVDVEIIVVDSGSTDETLSLVSDSADRVVSIRQEDFSYGGALNRGAEAAGAPVQMALSSHCTLPRRDWVERAAGHVEAGATAVMGQRVDGDRQPVLKAFRADHRYLVAHPFWGFSNHASVWCGARWKLHRFDESLSAAEDREWSWRATVDGGYVVIDPDLTVPMIHRRSAGTRALYRRLVREHCALPHLRPLAPYGVRDAVLDLARSEPRDPAIGRARRLGRTRLVKVAARWHGGRIAAAAAVPRRVAGTADDGSRDPAVVDLELDRHHHALR